MSRNEADPRPRPHLRSDTKMLYVTRFAEFPYFFKLITLFFTLVTLGSLMGTPTLPGSSSLICFTVVIALVVDVLLIVILMFELDRVQIIPIEGATYNAMESASSLTLSIFYFISIWMSFSGEEYTESGWFYLAAFACFANFVLYAADFAIYLRRWMIERRDARIEGATYEYPFYGAP